MIAAVRSSCNRRRYVLRCVAYELHAELPMRTWKHANDPYLTTCDPRDPQPHLACGAMDLLIDVVVSQSTPEFPDYRAAISPTHTLSEKELPNRELISVLGIECITAYTVM